MSAFGDPPPDLHRPGFGTPTPASRAPGPHGDGAPSTARLHVNGTQHHATLDPRTLLSDFLRHELQLTGTKVGCELGTCGSCTVHIDGEPALACLTLAVQVQDAQITTIEGLPHGRLQESFHEQHALQCGFCTAGMLMTLDAFLRANPDPTEQQVKDALSGNLCRCTGYKPIVEAVRNR